MSQGRRPQFAFETEPLEFPPQILKWRADDVMYNVILGESAGLELRWVGGKIAILDYPRIFRNAATSSSMPISDND